MVNILCCIDANDVPSMRRHLQQRLDNKNITVFPYKKPLKRISYVKSYGHSYSLYMCKMKQKQSNFHFSGGGGVKRLS